MNTEFVLRRKPSLYPWLLAAALTALLAGSLFRAYTQTGVGFFRMFGTIGLVLVGYFSTRMFYALQEADALERLATALAHLPDGFAAGPALSVRDPETGRPLVVDLTLVGRRALWLVAIDVTRPVASPSAALARWRRLAARLWRARRLLTPRLAAVGPVPVAAFILTLYRDPPLGGYVDGLPVLAIESLRDRVTALDQEEGAAGSATGSATTLGDEVRTRLLSALGAIPAEARENSSVSAASRAPAAPAAPAEREASAGPSARRSEGCER